LVRFPVSKERLTLHLQNPAEVGPRQAFEFLGQFRKKEGWEMVCGLASKNDILIVSKWVSNTNNTQNIHKLHNEVLEN
jgi:hypothetical protein